LRAWQDYLQSSAADAVVMLGDLFEAWVGDDSRTLAFEAQCVATLADASASRTLAFMVGNRDFLLGAEMLEACHMQGLADPTVMTAFGTRYLLSHGDALCIADTEYQAFRHRVREPQWQRDVLARPLEERQALAKQLRVGSMERQLERGGTLEVDVDSATALAWLARGRSDTLIHGHTHRPADHVLAAGKTRHVLSDWDFDHGPVARADVLRISPSGLSRHNLV
jgi:UDP-2,3-diacylglucosamine hydrolase